MRTTARPDGVKSAVSTVILNAVHHVRQRTRGVFLREGGFTQALRHDSIDSACRGPDRRAEGAAIKSPIAKRSDAASKLSGPSRYS
jgi:hypothetical protein